MSISIIAAGCTFPSGPTLALADIAIRTQLSLVRKHSHCVDRCGLPIKSSYFPQKELSFDVMRWQILAENALQDALQYCNVHMDLPSRLWLILPSADRPGVPSALEALLTASLSKQLANCLEITILRGGHAETGNALLLARQKQQHDRTLTLDIMVGVDSWLSPESLMWLEMQHLLHGSHTLYRGEARANPYGRIPGEGAAALILAPTNKLPAWGNLCGVATGLEAVLRNDDKPCIGLGLSQAVWQGVVQAGKPVISYIVSDMNGEPYRSDEYGFTVSRLHSIFCEDLKRITPVLASGDIGCASLLTHIAHIAWRLKNSAEFTAETSVLILSSSDDSQRSAIVMSHANQGRNVS